jgi:nickel/cobalt exporter
MSARGHAVLMTAALLYGASSGALHAVTGPDHVLCLSPAALERPQASFRIGLSWGAGHALGTLLLAVPLLVLAHVVHVPSLAAWGEHLAGAALIATALITLRSQAARAPAHAPLRSPSAVGLVHGVTGAGSLVLVLPVIVTGSLERALLFLFAFAVGSTLAMASLTSAIAKLGQRLDARTVTRAQRVLAVSALALGMYWLIP